MVQRIVASGARMMKIVKRKRLLIVFRNLAVPDGIAKVLFINLRFFKVLTLGLIPTPTPFTSPPTPTISPSSTCCKERMFKESIYVLVGKWIFDTVKKNALFKVKMKLFHLVAMTVYTEKKIKKPTNYYTAFQQVFLN